MRRWRPISTNIERDKGHRHGDRAEKRKPHQRRDGRLGSDRRSRGPRSGDVALEAVLRRFDGVRRRAQRACLAGRCGDAGHAAGHQRRMRRSGGAHRPRAQGQDQSPFDLRPQELFLSRPAAGLSDFPVQEPDRRRGGNPGRPHARPFHQGRDRAAASRAGRRQVPARPVADDELRRPQPLRRRL